MTFWRMPLDADKHELVVGKVNIIEIRCKGCGYCIEFCPNGVLAESEDFNAKGYHYPFVKENSKCIDCVFCETICPEFAIYITKLEGVKLKADDVLAGEKAGGRRRRRA